MRSNQIIKIFLSLLLLFTVTSTASAQDRYVYCKSMAQQATGYFGPVPDSSLPGGFIAGAAKGAATGAAVGWVVGKSVNTGKAAKRGAAIGGLVGLIKRAKAKKKQQNLQRAYNMELSACIAAGNQSSN